jgi:hypothetical protein
MQCPNCGYDSDNSDDDDEEIIHLAEHTRDFFNEFATWEYVQHDIAGIDQEWLVYWTHVMTIGEVPRDHRTILENPIVTKKRHDGGWQNANHFVNGYIFDFDAISALLAKLNCTVHGEKPELFIFADTSDDEGNSIILGIDPCGGLCGIIGSCLSDR